MKGVSAVIAIILILMIVVALAALAWTWFSGVFSQLTETAESSVTQTAEQMAQNFVLENAFCDTTTDILTVSVRNVGQATISEAEVTVYIDDVLVNPGDLTGPGTDITPQSVENFDADPTDWVLDCDTAQISRVTIASGLSKTKSITTG